MSLRRHCMTDVTDCDVRGMGSLVLCAKGLYKHFGGELVLDGVDLEMRRGEVILLTGANGAGKTTLVNILTGNLEPDAGFIELLANGTVERFRFPRRWWENVNPWDHFTPERVAREGVGRVWQDVRLFGTHALVDNIAVAAQDQAGERPSRLLFRPWEAVRQERTIRRTAISLLSDLGIEGRGNSSADKISLGQSKRVAIARAVQAGAKVLFLDEPLSGLDGQGIQEVLRLLRELVDRDKLTLLIVEHVLNADCVLNLVSTVWHMENGKVARQSPRDARRRSASDPADMISWFDTLKTPTSRVERSQLGGGASLVVLTPDVNVGSDRVLEVENLVVHRGSRLVIGESSGKSGTRGLYFSLRRNQLAVLLAPNAWGKTTLMEALAGLLPLTDGTIRLEGRRVDRIPPWKRVNLGLLFLQARNHGFPSLTVREAMALAGQDGAPSGLGSLMAKRMSELSGGEQQRVSLSSVLGHTKASVWLLDEPFASLDAEAVREDLVWPLRRRAVTTLVAVPSPLAGA